MEKTSSLDVHKDPGPHIRVQSGTYTPQLGLRFWLPERIGPGYVSLFSSGNPEPISTVPPRGYGAADWAHLLGGPLKNLAMGGFEAPDQPKSLKPWLKWVLLAAAAAIFLVMMAIEVFHVGKGG
jgi:hypothetical protein